MDDVFALLLVVAVALVVWFSLRFADEVEQGVAARYGRAARHRAIGLIRSRVLRRR